LCRYTRRVRGIELAKPEKPSRYYVLFCVTKYRDFQQAMSEASETIRIHLARSNLLHKQGNPIMAGAFLDNPDEPLTTMSVFTSREAAIEYVKGDAFVLNGMVSKWYIREWANALHV
jgi:uncharacterized protein YciI